MAFTADVTNDIGKVRLLIGDLDSTRPLFPDDAQIQAFIDMEGEIRWAAALGLEVIAGNRILTMQVVQLLDLKLDGKSTAQSLLDVAKRFREEGEDWCGFMVAQVVEDSMFAYRDYLMRLYFSGDSGSSTAPVTVPTAPTGPTIDTVLDIDALTSIDNLT